MIFTLYSDENLEEVLQGLQSDLKRVQSFHARHLIENEIEHIIDELHRRHKEDPFGNKLKWWSVTHDK